MTYCSNGFMQRLSNIHLWYMWKLCSYTLSMEDQYNFHRFECTSLWLIPYSKSKKNRNIYCVSLKSLHDLKIVKLIVVQLTKDYSNHYGCMCVHKQIQLRFSITIFNTHKQTSNHFMTEFEMEIWVHPKYA
jgi:hypothetical protein